MTVITKEDCEFYVKTDKAYTFKVTIDIMKKLLQKVLHLKLNKDGIFISQSEQETKNHTKPHHHLKSWYEAEMWSTFYCTQDRSLEINLTELCEICKNIKKKFSLLLFITKKEPNKLYIIPHPQTTYDDYSHLARRIPITDIKLSFSTSIEKVDYEFHNGLAHNIFHSMCKNFAGAKCSVFMFLMYPSGRVFCTSEGTFSDCFFENGRGTPEESEHEEKYLNYMLRSSREKKDDTSGDDEITNDIDEIEELLSFKFFVGTFNCKFLKDIQKLYGYGALVHIYADPIDPEKDEPIRPICFKCTAPDSFVMEIYVKSIEQINHEKTLASQ